MRLQQRRDHLGRVLRQRRRHAGNLQLLQVAREQRLFPAEEDLAIGRLRLQRRVVQGKQQHVVERHPEKVRRLQSAAQRDAIRQLGLNAQLIQHPVGIVVALALLDLLLGGEQLLHVLRLEVVVLVAEHRLPRLDVDRIVLAKHQARVGRLQRIAGQRIEVVVLLAMRPVQRRRMGVVVDGLDLIDLGHQAGIGLELLIGLRGKRGGDGKSENGGKRFHGRPDGQSDWATPKTPSHWIARGSRGSLTRRESLPQLHLCNSRGQGLGEVTLKGRSFSYAVASPCFVFVIPRRLHSLLKYSA